MSRDDLATKERRVLDELARIAGLGGVVTAQQLHQKGFPDFVANVLTLGTWESLRLLDSG